MLKTKQKENSSVLNVAPDDLDTFLEKNIYKTLRIFFIYQYLLMLLIVTIVILLQRFPS